MSSLLLDTNAFYWMLMQPGELSRDAEEAISDWNNPVFLSTVSIWELAIKLSIGKLLLRPGLSSWLRDELRDLDVGVVNVAVDHVLAVEQLPLHHSDPFDRLLIAQAQRERLTIVTRDKRFAAYDVSVIWT